jgi:hypothetical protein
MDGKSILWILMLVVGEQLGRRLVHPYFGVVYVPLILSARFAWARWADRGRRQRVAAIGSMPEGERRAAADALATEDERAAARMALGLVDPVVDGPQPAAEESFAYPRSWQRSLVWVYWLSLGMAGLILAIGYAQNVAARDDFLPWLGLVVGFGGGAALLRWGEHQVHTRIFVNVSGIGSIERSGQRRIILWSELVAVRPRPWLTQVDFYGRGRTRKIVASYHLERFPRLMELVAARLQTMHPE